jgi:hypothetical protein
MAGRPRWIRPHTECVPSPKASLYQAVMKRFVVDGSAPHYVELAIDLGVHPGAALALLHEVTAMALPNWLHPDTDLIASFAPFSNLPTPYRVSVSGRPHSYAQCGLESLAIMAFPRPRDMGRFTVSRLRRACHASDARRQAARPNSCEHGCPHQHSGSPVAGPISTCLKPDESLPVGRARSQGGTTRIQ